MTAWTVVLAILSFSSADPSSFDLEMMLKKGREALGNGDFSTALESLESCVELAPEDARPHFWLGRSRMANAQTLLAQGSDSDFFISASFSDSAVALRKAVEFAPEWGEAHGFLAQAVFSAGEGLEETILHGELAISFGDRSSETVIALTDALMAKRQTLLEAGESSAAESTSQRVLKILGDVSAHYVDEARAKRTPATNDEGSSESSISTIMTSGMTSDPQIIAHTEFAKPFAKLERKKAMAHWFRNEIAEARIAFERALEAEPNDIDSHAEFYNFANSVSDELDRALSFYHQLKGDGSLKWWFAAQLHIARGNKSYNTSEAAGALFHYNAALGALEASAALEPDFMEDAIATRETVEDYMAWAYLNLDQFRDAEKQFLNTLARDPDSQSAQSGLDQLGGRLFGASEAKKVTLGEVRDYFDRITDVVTQNADWWNNLGFFARDTGEYETSYEAYRNAAELDPENPRIQNDCALILIYHLKRNLEEAEQRCFNALKSGKKLYAGSTSEASRDQHFTAYTDAQLNLGRLYFDQKRFHQCQDILEELLYEHPGRPDAMLLLAQVEEKIRE